MNRRLAWKKLGAFYCHQHRPEGAVPVTDEMDLYDTDLAGDGERLKTTYVECAVCGKSLKPGEP